MSTTVVWPIDADWVADMLRSNFKLESPVSVWACGFDDNLRKICIFADVDDNDVDKLCEVTEPFIEIGSGPGVN